MNGLGEKAVVVWPLLTAEVLLFGTAAFVLLIAPGHDDSGRVGRAIAPLWRWLSILTAVFSPLGLLIETANMADVGLTAAAPFLPEVMRQTHFGRIWLWSLGPILALLAVTWIPRAWPMKSATVLALAALLLVLGSLSGHAIERGAAAVAIYLTHEMAAGLWLGSILGLWMGASAGESGRRWILEATPRVSRVCGWAVAALAATGAWTAYGSLGWSLDHLRYSLYGRTLLWKMATLSVALVLAAYNRYRLMPALQDSTAPAALVRSVAAEAIVLAAVLAWSALLANTPPSH